MERILRQVKPVSHFERLFLWVWIVQTYRKSRSNPHFAPLRRWPFLVCKEIGERPVDGHFGRLLYDAPQFLTIMKRSIFLILEVNYRPQTAVFAHFCLFVHIFGTRKVAQNDAFVQLFILEHASSCPLFSVILFYIIEVLEVLLCNAVGI